MASHLLIVRRGEADLFRYLQGHFDETHVRVIWDRRRGQRRADSQTVNHERREQDRRRRPPSTWDVGFFVVPRGASRPAPTAPRPHSVASMEDF